MNLRCVGEARKMHHWSCTLCITLMLFFGYNAASIIVDNSNYCYQTYKYGCSLSSESAALEYSEAEGHRSCSIDDIADDVDFTITLAKDGKSSIGIIKVNFTLPKAMCNYGIALVVNSSITNKEDCKNNVFHRTNSYENQVHSVERRVCVLPTSNETTTYNCQNETLSMWYEHIFTGCYALRFTVDGYKYSVRGNTFLVTDYIRTEVEEPKFRCYYEDQVDSELSKEPVRFVLRISVHAGTSMSLTLAPMSQHLDETRKNACNQYSENFLQTWEIITAETDLPLSNCSKFGNDENTENIDCNLVLQVPRNVSYCFQIALHDARCHRQTIWNPPPDSAGGKAPCTWLQTCTRISKNTSAIEYNGMIQSNKPINANHIYLLPIAVTVILIILIVTGTILFMYRSYSQRAGQAIYVNTNLRDLRITRMPSETDSVETTDDETAKVTYNGEEANAIILLYARGSPSFMSLMSDFREILKSYCGCHVHDWYAASEWDTVARIGPSAWVADLLRQKHRAIWIDTPRARSLFDLPWTDNHLTELKQPYVRYLDEEAISDFRDIALPSVLDLAKRNINPQPAIQYTRHFVVRLEGFDAAAAAPNRNEDPFEDLSPHTRYLIPYHLSELCSQISSRRPNVNAQRLKTEEGHLRERLIRMKTNNS